MDEAGSTTPFGDENLVDVSEDFSDVGGAGEARGRRSDRRRSSRRRRAKQQRLHQAQSRERRLQERTARRAAAVAARDAAEPTPPYDVAAQMGAEDSSAGSPEPVTRSAVRAAARSDRRRRTLASTGRGALVLALVIGAAGLGVGLRLATRDGDAPAMSDPQANVLPDGVDRQPALLLVTADDNAPTQAADSAIILAYDRLDDVATILMLPVSTATDVPGHGVLPLARALEFGGAALAQATTENLLGISVDGVAAMTYRNWATLLGRAGPLQIEVPQRLVTATEDGGTQVQFLAGVQSFNGPRAAEYLGASIAGEPELSALPRIQAIVLAWLELLAADQTVLDNLLADGLPMIDTGMARAEVVDLISAMVGAVRADRLEFRVLPVRPIGSGALDGYRPDQARLDELIADRFAGSLPAGSREGRALQILNGNGSPGIGQDVAARLLPAGFRVILTGNADNFEHDRTKIVIYDDSPEQLAIAAEIRALLGVGEVELSLTPQSVVDVTIVVGLDFPAS